MTENAQTVICLVSWPSAQLTRTLVERALRTLHFPLKIVSSLPFQLDSHLVQWSSYDDIDHELTFRLHDTVLASSYTFRKSLIRKHFLSRCLRLYTTKRPTTPLKPAIPITYDLELSFADELDEMWSDELWDLGQALESSNSWWILKPGMSDCGMGIRLFNTKQLLRHIFEDFEKSETEDHNVDKDNASTSTSVATWQLRHFVIQEYISSPLLLDPLDGRTGVLLAPYQPIGRKFHLRAYCVASGALTVYLYDRVLALFADSAYKEPVIATTDDGGFLPINLGPHLTNTSLQDNPTEDVVRLLDELVGCQVLSSQQTRQITVDDAAGVMDQVVIILRETFRAALENSVHFQPLPNAFELFGVDFLVAHVETPNASSFPYQVKLLEVNAEPAIEKTGQRLGWILEDLFSSIATVCVKPFIEKRRYGEGWTVGETQHHLIKCLDEEVRAGSSM